MPTRNMTHPEFEIEDTDEGVLIRFRVPGSRFGSVEIEFSLDEADTLASSLEQAVSFSEYLDAGGADERGPDLVSPTQPTLSAPPSSSSSPSSGGV